MWQAVFETIIIEAQYHHKLDCFAGLQPTY